MYLLIFKKIEEREISDFQETEVYKEKKIDEN